jgi:Skp family chaperone for outer membrane proteins
MPPINQQGSRAGLVATLVVFVVLFLIAAIMWIYESTEVQKTTAALATANQKFSQVVNTGQMAEGGEVGLINSAKEKLLNLPGNTTVDVALGEIRKLTADIDGTPATSFMIADDRANHAVKTAQHVLASTQPTSAPSVATGTPGTESLVAIVEKLTARLQEQIRTNDAAAADLAASRAAIDTRVKGWNDQLAELTKKLQDAEQQSADAQTKLAEASKGYDTKATDLTDSINKQVQESGAQVTQLQQEVAKSKAELAGAKKKLDGLEQRLAAFRPDVKNATIRQPDGTIIRVPSSTVCYINLGLGDHLPVGMTFEVYDKNEGVPGLTADSLTNNSLPVGKASVEVVQVGQNSSECRIVHTAPGATIAEGDLIANLVYDRNTTYNFVVFGAFDIEQTGAASGQQADVIKSLVTRWGGHLQPKVDANTDFVVIGKEPEVPALTKDQLDDPLLRAKYDQAVADLKSYQDIVNAAAELHVPIMNQNRFMYYIGYYDQMTR